MKRKVTLHGPSTLSVSLPLEWAKKHNIKKGEELEVIEERDAIRILAENNDGQKKECTIKLPELEARPILFLLRTLYIAGYDKIILEYEQTTAWHSRKNLVMTMPSLIAYEIKRLRGFEIMSITKNSCTIKSLIRESTEEFDDSMKRVFLLLKETTNDLPTIIIKGQPQLRQYAQDFHDHITVLLAYNLRTLNKIGYNNRRTTLCLHSFLYKLDDIIDLIKYMLVEMDGKLPLKNKEILHITTEFASLFEKISKLYNKFSLENAQDFFAYKYKLLTRINTLFGSTSKNERRYLHYLEDVLEEMLKLCIARMAMEY
ncbi:phosphate uptake regulator PhoU [Candidatus Woesearchaeota archaeon]|nr:phosphate uptake regulator PhoU [Candidatus Woesearchaeota archaeon]